jgi:glycosyltransferase involved in cell wall biosynthesis
MKCSVVICTYNYAHLLPDALQTLAAQTVQDFELVVVDDGSTDHTAEVVERFAPRFQNCVYFRKAHTGLADSRNQGVRRASGSHIAFLDADDLWSPNCLAAFRDAFLQNEQAEVVCCDGLRTLPSGVAAGALFPEGSPPLSGRINSAAALFSFFPYVAPSALMLARSAYERVGPFQGWSLTTGEDWDWIIRAAFQGVFFVRLDRKLVVYRQHGANLTSQGDKMLEGWLAIYKHTLGRQTRDPEYHALARRLTRKLALRLVLTYPRAKIRPALAAAIEAFEGDRLLQAVSLATDAGLIPALRLARLVKRAWLSLHPKSRRGYRGLAPLDVLGAERNPLR